MNMSRVLVLVGGLILVIGALLPWISVPNLFGLTEPAYKGIEVGWEDNGIVTGGVGWLLLLGGTVLKGRAGARYSIPGAILAGLVISVVLFCFRRILEINPRAGFFASTDVGIYVTLVGALLALGGSLSSVSARCEEEIAALTGGRT